MGFLVNSDIEGHVYIINGMGVLCNKRKAVLEKYGASSVQISERLCSINDLSTLGRKEVECVVDGLFLVPFPDSSRADLKVLYNECKRLRIPINVCEHSDLCTFSLPSVYEDQSFQFAISTNGMGCRLANRIKRACVNALPSHMGEICANIGRLRQNYADISSEEDEDDAEQSISLNQLVTTSKEDRKQKLRWLNQMVEYFPLEKLKSVDEEDLALESHKANLIRAVKGSRKMAKNGAISLVGAGPGSVGLLTTEALRDINSADYILADKLVPEEVLTLVPRRTPIFIARKFPGNAERAQEELLELGLSQLKQGMRVVRLKQGDPFIYGRGLEEYIFFKSHGFTPKVVAGITSALAAPVLAQIAPTHRGYADQILICTGTGRAGKLPDAPEWVESRTAIFLMALHRIEDVAALLISNKWPRDVPVAAIERASCPDQRIVRSTLAHISEALKVVGSRPPGLLVIGRVCAVIHQLGDGEKWTVEEN